MGSFPAAAAEVDATFLSAILGEQIVSVRHQAIGNGLVGDSARFEISYAGADAKGPASLAAKFPAADPTSRATAQAMRLYEKEVGFYDKIAPHVSIRTPKVYANKFDPGTGDFILLMEDLGPAKQGDQLAGCDFAEAIYAVRSLAALHGPSFERADLINLDFLATNDAVREFTVTGYIGACEAFVVKYEGAIAPDFLQIVAETGEKSAALWQDRPDHKHCIIHGDFRLDNILFAVRSGAEPMATLDWQTVNAGHPLVDLGYFMGAGIGAALRTEHGDTLIEEYADALVQNGGPLLSDIKESDGYARGALHGVATSVFSAAFVEDNDRARAIFQSMAEGACSLAEEINATRLLEG